MRARDRAEAFRIGPYLDAQERFVEQAYEAFADARAGSVS
jgi:hypothetical protein